MSKAATRDRFVFIRSSGGTVVGSELGEVGTYEDDREAAIGVVIRRPLALAPNVSDLLPACSVMDETSVQLPTKVLSSFGDRSGRPSNSDNQPR
jgi:hypothetical protein